MNSSSAAQITSRTDSFLIELMLGEAGKRFTLKPLYHRLRRFMEISRPTSRAPRAPCLAESQHAFRHLKRTELMNAVAAKFGRFADDQTIRNKDLVLTNKTLLEYTHVVDQERIYSASLYLKTRQKALHGHVVGQLTCG